MNDDLEPSLEVFEWLRGWEGPPHYEARLDPVASTAGRKVYDIGYGHVCAPGRLPLSGEAEACGLLLSDVEVFADGVKRMVTEPLTQWWFDGLICFSMNVGLDEDEDTIPEGLGDSRLLKLVNAGDFDGAAAQLHLWVHSGGKEVKGLVKRREAERAIVVSGDYSRRP
jgi:lysozyme